MGLFICQNLAIILAMEFFGSMVETIALTSWREVMVVNLDAAFLCSQAALAYFAAQDGRIIYMSGTAALFGIAQRAHVVGSEAALSDLARALTTELPNRRITVNCISPRLIDTELSLRSDTPPPQHLGRRLPVGRKAPPKKWLQPSAYWFQNMAHTSRARSSISTAA